MHDIFHAIAKWISNAIGSVWAAAAIIFLVLVTGAYAGFSVDWQAKVGVAASLLALLALVILQKSQNHSDRATHLKLDELIKSVDGARNEIASVEHETAREMDELAQDR